MDNKRVSKAKRRANKRWDDANRERKNYINRRSTARTFIRTMLSEDIPEFQQLLQERIKKEDSTE